MDSSTICPNLVPETTELKGPSDPLDAADLVIAAPHGGDLEDEVDGFIDDRAEVGVCIVQMDAKISR